MENKKIRTKNSEAFILLFLSLIAAFGPIVTDLYLPAMPQMNEVFNTSTSSVQLSLTVSFLGLAIGQLIFGPISDKYGRKIPLMISLLLFVLSTFGCIMAWNIQSFIVFRMFQGLSGAGGIVIARSVAVDLYQGNLLTKFLSLLAAVQGLAPIIAPLAGGILMKVTDWQGIFVVLLIIGIIILFVSFFYKESLPKENRIQGNFGNIFSRFVPVIKNKIFMCYTFGLSFGMGGAFFGYISASPFIFQSVYKLTPFMYALLFALNAVGLILGSQMASYVKNSKHAAKMGTTALVIFAAPLAVSLYLSLSVYVVEVFFFLFIFCLGFMMPAVTALALNLERNAAGNASAVLGFIQFLFGSIVSPLVGLGNVNISTGAALLVCSVLSLFFVSKALSFQNLIFVIKEY